VALTPGTRLGVYEVIAQIGEGGMGEVYRAADTKLKRQVAIKILPQALAADRDGLARFQREAEVLASLNHPNIAAIYGLEESGGMTALVMELVEGEDLSQRIARGAIPLDEALPIAKQIADALDAAHEQGIIHRDLKPANIKVRADGTVKVLDFGLAKAMEPVGTASPSASMSPTLSLHATQAGMILGTAAYMAPEQARGKVVDKRADIWAFGVVLYETLSGQRLFAAEDVSDTLVAVLTRNVSLASLPAVITAPLRALVRDCLIRDPRQRLRDIGDARIAIEQIMAGVPDDAPTPASVATVVPAWRRTLPWAAALIVAVVVGGFGWWRAMGPAELRPLQRFNVEISPDMPLSRVASAAISPDGTRLVVRLQSPGGITRLYMRSLAQSQLTALAGTDNATTPFFSPDSQWIGFVAAGKLRKVSVDGGAPLALCDALNAAIGASWGDDGNIVFVGAARTLMRVSSNGGVAAELTRLPEGPHSPESPQVLPGSDVVLYTARTGNTLRDDDNIEAFAIKTHRSVLLQKGGFSARYVATPSGGSLLYLHRGTLFAAPFDAARILVTGTPVPTVDGISSSLTGGGEYTVSRTGTLVYLSGSAQQGARSVAWIDRFGHVEPFPATPGPYFSPRLSPDGKRLAMSMDLDSQTAIEIQDENRSPPSRLTISDGVNEYPVWTPDGQYIVFHSTRAGAPGLYRARSDGAGEPQRISDDRLIEHPYSISPDGKRLALIVRGVNGKADIATAAITGESSRPALGKIEPFFATPQSEGFPAFSPDGRWLAYVSNESGAAEVYVRPFPGPGGRWQISSGGGGAPTWSRSASELLFRERDRVMIVRYTATAGSFTAGKPQAWPDAHVLGFGTVHAWDLAPDGQRLVVLQDNPEDARPVTHLTFLLHFSDELQQLAVGVHHEVKK
jgi:Tol biopolymer transport system component